jgi:hypothetical protein
MLPSPFGYLEFIINDADAELLISIVDIQSPAAIPFGITCELTKIHAALLISVTKKNSDLLSNNNTALQLNCLI